MWHYTGPEDSTRTNVVAVDRGEVTVVLQITGPRESQRISASEALHMDHPPPNQEWTNWFSPVSNGNPAEEEEEGSQEGSVESTEYVFDSGESKEETSEEEEEDEEQDSPPPNPEHRTKRRHEPAVPSAPPASSSAPPAAPAVPSVRSTKRTRDAAELRVGLLSSYFATSPKTSEDDPMDTHNAVSSQPKVLEGRMFYTIVSRQCFFLFPRPRVIRSIEAICPGEGDRGEPTQVEPVLEAAPPAAALAADVLPTEALPQTEPVLVGEEPIADLGCLRTSDDSRFVNAEFSIQRLPEEQVERQGAMKTCEMGSAYETLKAERNQFAGELDAAMLAMAGMKDALAEREKSLEQAREVNKVLTEEVEKMGKQRTALMSQMDVLNKRCRAQEKYVSDWARQMMTRVADFCFDAEAEATDVERSILENIPLGDDANRDLLRAHIRVGKVGPFIGGLREVVGRIDKELWPEDESRQEMENLMTRLEEIPNGV
ncbi:hypothetical protein ZWY2020_039694 [Hordeum vulgare]|nr:hypothetical protein ZWY2020_039694 [Hordeum vulgare]